MIRWNKISALLRTCCIILYMYLFSSCSSSSNLNREFVYFQNGLDSNGTVKLKERVIQVNDQLGIQFFSKSMNQEQAALFNIPNNSTSNNLSGYLINTEGNIEIPLIGKIRAVGLTKDQLQELLTDKLSSYIKDPSVLIRFMQFNVNIIGEVKNPGLHSFQTDRVTIIDAISAAGDLTDNGKRKNILVIREEHMQRKYYRVDLTSGDIFLSPVYQLQPNDIIYVSASYKKLVEVSRRPSRDMGGWQFAMSLISVAVSVIFVVYTIKK
jgi:polysaccharide export outer membrane protein